MSTKCQIMVQDGQDSVMLYRQLDGSPTNILELLEKAYRIRRKVDWKLVRAGKVAGLICASDPGEIEPGNGLDLDRDINYFYVVNCIGKELGMAEEPM